MKRILLLPLLLVTTNVNAGGNWVAPLVGGLVGGAIITEIVANRPTVPVYPQPYGYYQQPPVQIYQPPVYYPQPEIYYQQPYYGHREYYYERR